MTEPDTTWLMRHDAPRPSRRRTRWLGLGTRHPRCDGCGRQLWPGDDHTECQEET